MINLLIEKENRRIDQIIYYLSKLGGDEDYNRENNFIIGNEEILDSEKITRNRYLILRDFLLQKRMEGCTNETVRVYYLTLFNFINELKDIPLQNITTQNIRFYLSMYGSTHKITNIGLDSIRRTLSSFFGWMKAEEYITVNPMDRVRRIKTEKIIKTAFTDEEIERLRDAAIDYREKAILDFLISSGVRVSELCLLNKDDLNITEREGVVFGKGRKERFIYFDAKAKLHVNDYINSRIDDNPALFVSSRYPFQRLSKGAIEHIVKRIGDRAGVPNVYPHRFRRTLATRLLDKGVPLEQVQQIMGHSKMDTTLLYALVNQNTVKINHRRFI